MIALTKPLKTLRIATGVSLALVVSLVSAMEPDLSNHAGGVVVYVGLGAVDQLRQTATNDAFFTLGLTTNTTDAFDLRKTLREEGYSGQVLVDDWNGTDLPFIDNFVNALILKNPAQVNSSEVSRVLVPNGTIYQQVGTNWIASIKPRTTAIDDWTHWDYSAANNRCSSDLLVGPLRRMQWYAEPFWTKYHFSSATVQFIVSSGGRIFYAVDESPTSTLGGGFPEKWMLIARDAFNGKLLWKRPFGFWGMAAYDYKAFVDAVVLNAHYTRQQKRFVAADDQLFGVLDNDGPVVAMDAATGEILRTFPDTESCQSIHYLNNRLYLRKTGNPGLMVFDTETGDLIWSRSSGGNQISVNNNLLCILSGSSIIALDASTFTEQWISSGNNSITAWRGYLIDAGPVVISRGNSSWIAFDTTDGEFLWSYPISSKSPAGSTRPEQIFATSNRVWTFKNDITMVGLDPLTGAEQVLVDAQNVFDADHHHRCHDDRATERWFISARRGIEMTSITGGTNQLHNWTRATCNIGSVPANGLLYVPPAACACMYSAMLHGFYSYAPASPDVGRTYAEKDRLITGPAFGLVSGGVAGADDWPQYRYNENRKSATDSYVPQILEQMWKIDLDGKLTPPVIADNRLFVGNRTDHTVCALDASSGKILWEHAPGGEVENPPSVWGDCVIFGCTDGRVYCLRASDGTLVWRFQAAPRDCRNMQLEDITSVWPVPGVMIDNGAVYCSAGHSSRLDGGIWIYKLDALTGSVLASNQISHVSPPVPAPTNDVGNDRDGNKNDIMVGDGGLLFLREVVLTPSLVETTTSRKDHLASEGNGFMDSSWHHRQAWTYNQIFGQCLSVDDENVYGIKAHTGWQQWGHDGAGSFHSSYQPGSGYLLFAQNINNTRVTEISETGVQNELRPKPLKEHLWWKRVPLRVQAMIRAGDYLFAAGQPDILDRNDPFAAFEGRAGGLLWTVSPADGTRLSEINLISPPVFDGLAAANNSLYLSTMDGSVLCLGQPESEPVAHASVSPSSGSTATQFSFDGTDSRDADGQVVRYEWAVDNAVVSAEATFSTSFGTEGGRVVRLTVWDDDGMLGSDTEVLSITSPANDSDSDGLPDEWEINQVGNLSMNPKDLNDSDSLSALEEYVYGTSPFLNDSDGDGLADHHEVSSGSDPTSADSLLAVHATALLDGQVHLEWESAPGRTYSVWGSSNLTSGLNELVVHHLNATPPVNTFTDSTVRRNGTYFYRIQTVQKTPSSLPNSPPTVNDDEAFATTQTAKTIDVLSNDSDPNAHSLAIRAVTDAAHGIVSHNTSNLTYTSQAGWTGTDTFSYTVQDEHGATASGQVNVYVESSANRAADPFMKQVHLADDSLSTDNAQKGWFVGTDRAWEWDRGNEWSYALCGSNEADDIGMAQIIADYKASKNTQKIEFDATHQGFGDTLQVKVYGANGSLSYSPKNTMVSSATLLYDSGNVADSEFDWTTFFGTFDCGSGYNYYVILVLTDGICPAEDEFIAVDNFFFGKPPERNQYLTVQP